MVLSKKKEIAYVWGLNKYPSMEMAHMKIANYLTLCMQLSGQKCTKFGKNT